MIKGITCLTCHSVIFTITALLEHLNENPAHKWFRFSDKGVLYSKLFKEVIEQ